MQSVASNLGQIICKFVYCLHGKDFMQTKKNQYFFQLVFKKYRGLALFKVSDTEFHKLSILLEQVKRHEIHHKRPSGNASDNNRVRRELPWLKFANCEEDLTNSAIQPPFEKENKI